MAVSKSTEKINSLVFLRPPPDRDELPANSRSDAVFLVRF
jgi:hypothetical protein